MECGIQVSSFKPLLTTPEEVRTAFARIRQMDCTVVQLQWIDRAVPVDVIASALRENGLRSISVQELCEAFLADADYYIQLNAATGGEWLCLSRIPASFRTAEGLPAFCEVLRQLAERVRPLGMRLCFHPVAPDYEPIDGKPAVFRLLESMPELALCIDLYHAARCGFDLPGLLRAWAGRVCMVHFKDYLHLPDGTEALTPAGTGEIDWTGVKAACLETGVPYAFAEQERWQGDPFECLAQALAWVREEEG